MMSGGSYNYEYARIEEEYVGAVFDDELDEMIRDLCKLLKDLEWWQSNDSDKERYRDSLQKFKNKWFTDKRKSREPSDDFKKLVKRAAEVRRVFSRLNDGHVFNQQYRLGVIDAMDSVLYGKCKLNRIVDDFFRDEIKNEEGDT